MNKEESLEQRLQARDIVKGVAILLSRAIKPRFDFRKHPIKAVRNTLFLGVYGVILCSSIQNAKIQQYNSQLTEEVSILADTNRDNAVTSEEWATVYRGLGVKYDASGFDPRKDLTIEQKERYIRAHN